MLGKRHHHTYVCSTKYNLAIGDELGYKIELSHVKKLTNMVNETPLVIDQIEIVDRGLPWV